MIKRGKFAEITYQKQDEKLILELNKYIDEKAEEIFAFFKIDKPDRCVQINIFPTKKDYDENYRRERNWGNDVKVESWKIGEFLDGKINYLSINDYKSTSHAFKEEDYDKALDYFKKTIVHEFVHYVNDLFCAKNRCDNTEKYLAEGLATYLSGQNSGKNIIFDFSVEKLLDDNAYCYDGYYWVTKYLIENYPQDFVLDLIKSSEKSREFLKQELFDKTKNYYNTKQ